MVTTYDASGSVSQSSAGVASTGAQPPDDAGKSASHLTRAEEELEIAHRAFAKLRPARQKRVDRLRQAVQGTMYGVEAVELAHNMLGEPGVGP